MEPMNWLLVSTAITLIFIVIAISPMQAATEEAVSSNVYLQVRRIASIINMVSSGPDGMLYTMDMPVKDCTLLITPDIVKLGIKSSKDFSEAYGLIKPSGISGPPKQFKCSDTQKVKISKDNGVVTFGV